MKFNALFAAAALAPLAFAATAHASPIAYGTLRAGVATGSVSFGGGSLDTQQGNSFGAALGSHLGPFRIELGADNSTADLFPGVQGNLITYSATAFLDSPIKVGDLTPYVGLGADYSKAKVNVIFGHIESGYNSGYHWDVGASAPINDRWDIELNRREHHGSVNIAGASPDVETVAYTIGLRRAF
jgi:hypothetical protein